MPDLFSGYTFVVPIFQCTLTIKATNSAGLGLDQLTAAEQQIDSLFGPNVGVNFVSSGPADYTLNFENAGSNHTDLGHQTSFLFFQFSPVVHPNNISGDFQGWPTATINNIIGTVGAHELMHRITGVGDLKFNPSEPSDLMSSDHNPDAGNLFVHNGFQLTSTEMQQLFDKCQQKHPN